MYEVINLETLSIHDLEKALLNGEGTTVEILDIHSRVTYKKIWVMSPIGEAVEIATNVAYEVRIRDDMEEDGEIVATIHVEVKKVGLVAMY